MTRRFVAVVVPDPEDGGYVPSVPGVYGQGETEEEAYQDVVQALRALHEYLEEEGREVPEAIPPEGHLREIELAV
jgi:predicted RNase H-like HicB family nuclease